MKKNHVFTGENYKENHSDTYLFRCNLFPGRMALFFYFRRMQKIISLLVVKQLTIIILNFLLALYPVLI